MFDKLHEECGVFGIYGHPEAANMAYLGLYALQHRGQESAGIAVADGVRIRALRQMGYVAEIFTQPALATLPGHIAIGHTRYSTAGESTVANAQPLLIDCVHGQVGICHNGNIVNAREIRDELVRQGSIFQTNSDTEVALHLFARSQAPAVDDAIVESVARLVRLHHQGPPGRRARPARLPPAGARPARRRLGRLLRDVRDGSRGRDFRS
jgi:amidophosphoribosyltransferase